MNEPADTLDDASHGVPKLLLDVRDRILPVRLIADVQLEHTHIRANALGRGLPAGQVVGSSDALEEVVVQRSVSIGVIATPATAAQGVCDRLVATGVTSILNFAPVVLNVPMGVDVRKVDLSIELQILAFHAQRRSDVRVASGGKNHYRAGVGLAALAGSPGESVTAP